MKKVFNNIGNIDLFNMPASIEEPEKVLFYYEQNTKRIYEEMNKPAKAYRNIVASKYKEYLDGIPSKVTPEEKEVIEKQYKKILELKALVKDKIDLTESVLKKSMDKRKKSYSLPIVKNKKLKRASKRFFGEKKSEITFEDYQKALKRKKELESFESGSLLEKIED